MLFFVKCFYTVKTTASRWTRYFLLCQTNEKLVHHQIDYMNKNIVYCYLKFDKKH